jgi:hypothetical protein
MFEMIGLVVGTIVLLFISSLAGIVYALIAWFILRRRHARTPRLLLLFAAALPSLCMIYMLLFSVCWTTFVDAAHESVFGDISEPLPNGYTLSGLAKMSEYSHIDPPQSRMWMNHTPDDVGLLCEEGPLLFGAVSQSFGSATPLKPPLRYFKLDTGSGQVSVFDSFTDLEAAAGHPLHLQPTADFRTQDAHSLHLRRIGDALRYWPPEAAMMAYLVLLIVIGFRKRR